MRDDGLKERVRESVDIVDVIGERLPLRKRGKNFIARCPFHQEKTPSFNVNPEMQIYHCFGCGAGGDVFRFLMEFDKVSFPEALRTLADRAGIRFEQGTRNAFEQRKRDALDAYYEANGLARALFTEALRAEDGAHAVEYLKDRGLTGETVKCFGIGYAPESWDRMLGHLRANGISQDVMIESGLVVQNESGRTYDRFRNRITFPIINVSGRVVGFGARALSPD